MIAIVGPKCMSAPTLRLASNVGQSLADYILAFLIYTSRGTDKSSTCLVRVQLNLLWFFPVIFIIALSSQIPWSLDYLSSRCNSHGITASLFILSLSPSLNASRCVFFGLHIA
jgi:hypothetical protein